MPKKTQMCAYALVEGDADAVVLSGHSAGGLATYLHADYVRKQLPPALGFYAAVPDAG